MIYIESGSNSPYYNFALEYYLMTEKTFDDMIFLFWRTSPTLMVGKFQNTYSEIDLDYARSRNIQIVRRLSGGGTIYTDMGSWQFTFISPNRSESPAIEFTRFITPIVNAIRELGVDASFNGRNDLIVSGKKFSGNAQYIKNGRTLHHGSLLFDTNIEEMVRASTVDEEKVLSKGIKSVKDRVTNLKEHLPNPLSMEEFKAVMVRKILDSPSSEQAGYEYLLTEEDCARIRQIEKEQFDNPEKIFGANPRCQLHLKKVFPGAGTIHSHIDLEKGRIRQLHLFGDFFGDVNLEEIYSCLLLCPYTKEDVLGRLQSLPSSSFIYGISKEDLADALF